MRRNKPVSINERTVTRYSLGQRPVVQRHTSHTVPKAVTNWLCAKVLVPDYLATDLQSCVDDWLSDLDNQDYNRDNGLPELWLGRRGGGCLNFLVSPHEGNKTNRQTGPSMRASNLFLF